MRRALFRAVAAAAILLLLAGAAVTWLLTSASGLEFVWNRVEGFLPAEVEVRAIGGRLIGPLIIENLALSAPTLRVTVERAELEWEPLALIGRTFNVDRLALSGLDVRVIGRGDEAPDDEPFALPPSINLPLAVNVEVATLEGFRLFHSADAEPLIVDDAAMSVHFDDDELLLHELVLNAPLFGATGRINIEPRGEYRSEAELDWTVRPPELPEAAGTVLLLGDARELVVELRAAAPYALEARIAVADPLARISFDGGLSFGVEPAALGVEAPFESLQASMTIGGVMDDLGMEGRVQLAAPQLADAQLDFDGRYVGEAVVFEALRISIPDTAAELNLAGRVELTPAAAVDLDGEWSSLQWPLQGEPTFASASGSLRLTGTPDSLRADLDADAGAGGRIEGNVQRSSERITADLQWRNIGWPQSMPQVSSDNGMLSVGGTLDDYRLTLDAALAIAGGTEGQVTAAGTGDLASIDFERLDIAALEGTVVGNGAIAWDPEIRADLNLVASGIDPGVIDATWGGSIDARVQGSAAMAAEGPSVRIDVLNVAGELRDRPIELDASGSFATGAAAVERFELRSGASRVDLSGAIGADLDFEWQIESPDLADLWPEASGRLDARGSASGPRLRPIVGLDVNGAELAMFGLSVEDLSIVGQVDAAGTIESQLDVKARTARFEGYELERLDVTADGDAARHVVSIAAAGEGVQLDLAVEGSAERAWQSDFGWRFEVDRARLAYTELSPWVLREPASGLVTRTGTRLDEACWQSGSASFCVEAEQQQGTTQAVFALERLPFQYFSAWLPSGTRVTGTVGAAGALTLAPDAAPSFAVDVTTSRARIGTDVAAAGVAGLSLESGTARVSWQGGRLEADVDLPFEGQQGGVELQAAVLETPGAPFTASALEGNLLIEARDLAFLSEFSNDVEDTAGALSGDIALSGTVGLPRIAGRLELTDGTARLREPGVVLEDVRLALVGDGTGDISVAAAGSSGGGTFEADGVLSLDASRPVGRIRVRGDSVELFDTPDAHVFVTPDLALVLAPQRLEVTGNVAVPRASITPRGTTEGAVQVSPDQVIVDAEETEASALTRPLFAQVVIELGDDVTFEGFGLTGELGGALEIVEVSGEPTTGSGELRVTEGTYEAYGQELEIRTGRLVFAGGALTRPGLDIEAVRRPDEDVLVGARVRGTLRQPELSIFSEPPMPQQEQLSYLVLGRPLESASASENSALSQAALALGLRGGNFVSERLNRALGFDEFGIQTQPGEDANAASFVIGKYLSPSLYVSYGVGLFQPVNTLRLRYTISSRWRLVTESSAEGSGGDLIYHIERGD